jgi:hypothetical protein
MRQFTVTDGKFAQVEHTIEDMERPPIVEIPEYMQRFHPVTEAVAQT